MPESTAAFRTAHLIARVAWRIPLHPCGGTSHGTYTVTVISPPPQSRASAIRKHRSAAVTVD